MNREKKDKIPSMQVSFIDAICTQLYQVPGGGPVPVFGSGLDRKQPTGSPPG